MSRVQIKYHNIATRTIANPEPMLEMLDYIYYPYWQYTNHFIFRFVSVLCLRSTLRLFQIKLSAGLSIIERGNAWFGNAMKFIKPSLKGAGEQYFVFELNTKFEF